MIKLSRTGIGLLSAQYKSVLIKCMILNLGAFIFGGIMLPNEVLSADSDNYYYTFRVDERVEAIEFTEELKSNKKEMSSLDFMPIKSSSDLRINLIKAEDPLTFSAKTRDDSLVLMEV